MHELSIAHDIVELAVEAAERAKAERVIAVNLKVGRLSGIESGALLFSYDTATHGTILEGSQLTIIDVPLVVWCAHCLKEVELPTVSHFRCPTCDTLCGEVRSGRELDIESLEIEP